MEEELEPPPIVHSCMCRQCRAKRAATSTKNRRFWKRQQNKFIRKNNIGSTRNHYWA